MGETVGNVDLNEDRVFPVASGLIYRVVCAPSTWSDDRISEAVTAASPPGTINNRWEVSSAKAASKHRQWQHETARKPCPDCDHRVHVLMNC